MIEILEGGLYVSLWVAIMSTDLLYILYTVAQSIIQVPQTYEVAEPRGVVAITF